MTPIRFVLLLAAPLITWRMLRGRSRQLFQRALQVPEHGTHTSAASAANGGYRDDRDVTVGEHLSAVGMRPGRL